MRMSFPRRALLSCTLFSAAVGALPAPDGAASAAEPVARESFAELHDLIKPNDAEQAWTQIPWMASLWDARVKAAAEGKPILLWEMDGHPLGCV